jgi:sRNA-binding carbon storage regulator CsrA
MALVLNRKPGSSIKIILPDGRLITVVIGYYRKMLIYAPDDIVVHRNEVFQKILNENDGCIPDTNYRS